MSSFFEFMKRAVEGKPIFDDAAATSPTTEKPSVEPSQPAIRKGDDHSFPVVYIKRATTKFGSTDMQVYARIVNTWHEEVMLDKIYILNVKRELDTFLRAGEEREFLVYSGPKISQQHHDAQLDYKTRGEGDYFQSVHDVTFTYHSDKTYSINEIRFDPPVRDIYG